MVECMASPDIRVRAHLPNSAPIVCARTTLQGEVLDLSNGVREFVTHEMAWKLLAPLLAPGAIIKKVRVREA
jgi:hypothetical protein